MFDTIRLCWFTRMSAFLYRLHKHLLGHRRRDEKASAFGVKLSGRMRLPKRSDPAHLLTTKKPLRDVHLFVGQEREALSVIGLKATM